MKTYIISNREVRMLRDIQVAFHLEHGLVVVDQIEILADFTGDYERADLNKFSANDKDRIEEICANWFNAQPRRDHFNNDDLTIA